MAEGAQEKRAASMCRSLIAFAFSVSFFIVILGGGLNSLQQKYSRTTHKALTNCRREIFILSVPDSKHCCDSAIHSLDWVCVASFDKVNRILSSTWAFTIPLLPFLMTICSSYASEYVTQKSSRESHSRRLLLYICIILYRSYFLYLGGDYIQTFLQKKSRLANECWYFDLVKGSCIDHFDFSDHLVLYMVQYLLPCAIELSYVYSLQKGNVVQGIMRAYYLTVAVSTIIILVSLRGMLFTGMFFHTASESLFALCIVFIFAYMPAYVLSTYFPFHVKETISKSEEKKNM